MDRKYELTRNNKIACIIMILIGVIAVIVGFSTNSDRAWASLLHNNFYFMAISLCGTFFMAVNYIAQAGWSVGIKRVPEAMGGYLKFGMLAMILIFIFGHHDLYHWTHYSFEELSNPHGEHFDPVLAGKTGYLNQPFFYARMIAYTLIWVGFTYILRRNSLMEDEQGGLRFYRKSVTQSAIFVALFAVTSSTMAWDFLMSIDAHWFSTMFGWYTFIGLFVSGLAMMCLIILYLRTRGYMMHVTENHFHDVGKFMFAFSIFWTYLWFSQFMLIWYANLPEEVVYYQVRWNYFKFLWAFNLIINFCAPFLILMTRDAKRQKSILWIAGIIILGGHWLDVYMMVMPGIVGAEWTIGFIELGTMVGFLGLFLFVTLSELSKAALVPKHHPMLQESLHHHI
jgi:hypothetical protein